MPNKISYIPIEIFDTIYIYKISDMLYKISDMLFKTSDIVYQISDLINKISDSNISDIKKGI